MGLSDSWESYYQAVRREWRYGQNKPVDVYIIMSQSEQEVYTNVMRKDAMAKRLRTKLIEHMGEYEREELKRESILVEDYKQDTVKGDGCCRHVR